MNRLFTIAVLTISLLALLAACGNEATPTENPGPASSAAQDLKQAAQELWDTFSASTQTLDGAAALHGIFITDIRERCTVEQMQETLWSGEGAFPDIEVRSVFLDLEDPSRALMQLALLDPPEGNPKAEGNLPGIASGFAYAFPFPLVREQGEWRLGFPILAWGTEPGCPFAENPGQQASERSASTATATPTFSFSPYQLPAHLEEFLQRPPKPEENYEPYLPDIAPPAGLKYAKEFRSRSRGGDIDLGSLLEFSFQAYLITDKAPGILEEHYRERLLGRGWHLEDQAGTPAVALSAWTFRDDHGEQFHGFLVVRSLKEHKRVELSVVWMK